MKLRYALSPAIALTVGAMLLQTPESQGFTKLGLDQNQDQRVFRVRNNFTDTAANNNNTPDPDWPGFDGAEFAIWKGCVEWGSQLHGGNGDGDPHQPGGLGSGGARFDALFVGNATGIGNVGDQIHSELNGSNGGVLAFTESFGSGAWRIRYYSGWTWNDGPDTGVSGGSNFDLQGVAAHEFGHALGLGHTSSSGATMRATIIGRGVANRSIESDDIAGVQSIYGYVGVAKVIVTGVTGTTVLTITGVNFDLVDNEVWFTRDAPTANPNPVKVKNIPSDGTTLTVTVPPGAGPGDLMVRSSNGHKGLSNTWPLDAVPCGSITTFCTAGTTANGCRAQISASGVPSGTTGSGFDITVNGVEGNKQGLLFYGITGAAASPWGNGTSFRCVLAPTQRTPAQDTGGTAGACDGTMTLDWNAFVANKPNALGNPFTGGEIVWAQGWFRDPPSAKTTSLSNGLEFTVCN